MGEEKGRLIAPLAADESIHCVLIYIHLGEGVSGIFNFNEEWTMDSNDVPFRPNIGVQCVIRWMFSLVCGFFIFYYLFILLSMENNNLEK